VIPEDISMPQPGMIAASLKISRNLLSTTAYAVNAKVNFLMDDKPIPITVDNILAFRVYAPAEDFQANGRPRARENGVVSPRLDWEVSAVEQGIAAVS
jgi:hypothetical protein